MDKKVNISGVDDSLIKNETKKVKNSKGLRGKKIAISVSINEDLEANGLSLQHINDISIEIARYIISNGGTALYGGDLRNGGFTEYFSELSNQYKIANDRSFRFINYFSFPNSKDITKNIQIDFKSKQIKPEILPLPKSLKAIDIDKVYKPLESYEDRYTYCECFKEMRVKMAKDCSARVLVGGKITNYLGYVPGVIEEALFTLLENKPIYLVGGFGGATANLIQLIKGEDVNELSNDFQHKTKFLIGYREYIAKNGHSIPPSAGQSEPPAADQSEHSGADEREPLKRSILFECCDGFFCKKDHGEQTDRYAKGKKDLQIVRRGGQQATDQQGTWHLPQHGGQVHRVLQVLQADALRGLGDDPGGDPQALQGGPKAQERTAEDLRAVLPLF